MVNLHEYYCVPAMISVYIILKRAPACNFRKQRFFPFQPYNSVSKKPLPEVRKRQYAEWDRFFPQSKIPRGRARAQPRGLVDFIHEDMSKQFFNVEITIIDTMSASKEVSNIIQETNPEGYNTETKKKKENHAFNLLSLFGRGYCACLQFESIFRRGGTGDLYTSCSAGSMCSIAFRPCFLYENSSQPLLILSQFLAAVFGG